MKKMIQTAFIYAIAAMCGGVFYREFTKFQGFSGKTTLSVVHTHLFLLGMMLFLVAALFCQNRKLTENKKFCWFYRLYNIGVPVTALMLLCRGITQVLEMKLSGAMDGAISGIAGIGHILTGVGIVFFFLALKESIAKEET